MWCITEINAEFRERMYDILDLYEQPYDFRKPVVCVDEKPKQLLSDIRKHIPMKPGRCMRYDYEYKRNGTANIFVAVEPKAGRRITNVTGRRTKKDFAQFMKKLVRTHPRASQIQVVADNLNTHKPESLRETFSEQEAERLLRKIEFHYTPKHASWLNAAEIEISVMDAQCTGTRIKDKQTLKKEVKNWTQQRNKHKNKINWKFTKQKADQKLSKYYVP